ncbi:MAG: class I SAM-dependent methyltransferase [Immundisolibacter sp.]|uniref:class I SAM-dependent methyltransferase n=1 Tax=Immundisolibacter sp. TaxID=1934948 RepID=UPI003D0C877E
MTVENPSSGAITTQSYWENEWENQALPLPIDPLSNPTEHHFYRLLDKLFSDHLPVTEQRTTRLLEIGCGTSRWLPYFSTRFGLEVSGIDYTTSGVRRAQAILDNANVCGDIRQGDLFDPPSDWLGHFDIVVSFGVVEHFRHPADVLTACARYLRPGGSMFTLVPTMRGLYGLAYRLLRPAIYRLHVPHTKTSLAAAHASAGLNVTESGYLLGLPSIITPPIRASRGIRLAYQACNIYSRVERAGWGIPPNRFTSPYSYCVAVQ